MITCIITYDIDPNRRDLFERYARNWGQCTERCGATLIGYFAPHEGSTSTAYGIYSLPSLADYEAYRARLAADPLGQRTMNLPAARALSGTRAGCSSSWPRRPTVMRHDRGDLRGLGLTRGQADYLDLAAQLRPHLAQVDGFVSIERFASLTTPGKVLSCPSGAMRRRWHSGATCPNTAAPSRREGRMSLPITGCGSPVSCVIMA
jgi:hypothetical protein